MSDTNNKSFTNLLLCLAHTWNSGFARTADPNSKEGEREADLELDIIALCQKELFGEYDFKKYTTDLWELESMLKNKSDRQFSE